MNKHISINTEQLAKSNDYRDSLIGTPARYTTVNGTEVVGTITEHLTAPGGLMLAITRSDGRWASIHAGETFEAING